MCCNMQFSVLLLEICHIVKLGNPVGLNTIFILKIVSVSIRIRCIKNRRFSLNLVIFIFVFASNQFFRKIFQLYNSWPILFSSHFYCSICNSCYFILFLYYVAKLCIYHWPVKREFIIGLIFNVNHLAQLHVQVHLQLNCGPTCTLECRSQTYFGSLQGLIHMFRKFECTVYIFIVGDIIMIL